MTKPYNLKKVETNQLTILINKMNRDKKLKYYF